MKWLFRLFRRKKRLRDLTGFSRTVALSVMQATPESRK